MTFLKQSRLLLRAATLVWPALLAALLIFSCNTGEEGGTYLKVRVDSTWFGYDSIQVLVDKGDGKGPQRVFGGKVDDASDLNRIPADGYDGGEVTIVIRAYQGGVIARAEDREYDGRQQKTLEVIVIVKPGGHDTDTTVTKDGLTLSLLPKDTLVTIGDSVAFAASAKNASGNVSEASWDLNGDGLTDLTSEPGTATADLSAGLRFPAAGTFHPTLTIKGSNGSRLSQSARVRVVQDAPTANAGPDFEAQAGIEITLSGSGKDSLGRIVKQEWQAGSGEFQDAPGGKLAYRTPASAGDVQAVFRVTDDDGQVARDTVIIHVTLAPDTSKDTLRLSLTTRDTLISIGDSASYAAGAKNAKGKLTKAAWDLDGDGMVDSIVQLDSDTAALNAGYRFAKAGTYRPSMTLTGARGGTLQVTLSIRVVEDAPTADAGPDLTAPTDSTLNLSGKAKDGLGRIVKQEWSLAGGAFAASADGMTTYKTPSTPGDIVAIFRATDDDGLSATDTLLIHVISPAVAALTELKVSNCALSPAFNPDSLAYACPAPYGTASVTVTAKAQGTMTLNGAALASGTASGPVTLSAGKATLTLKVANGSANRTYTVNVTSAAASGNNALRGLVLSVGSLDPAFAAGTPAYTAVVASTVASVTVTATVADTTATLTINSAPATSGQASAAIALGSADKVIPIVVTAQDGQARNYSITVKRKSGNANLRALTVSSGALSPAFAAGTPAYSDTVSETLASINVTASPEDTGKASMTLNGAPLTAGTAKAVALTQKETTVTIVVRAEDSAVTKTYTLKVVRRDDVPPTAPTVALGAYAAPDRPSWTWTAGGGGSGNFRYKVDDANLAAGATATTATSYAPTSDLTPGSHTLYVQERDTAGNWSASGRLAVTVGALSGIADYPFVGHASDTLGNNADATMTAAPFLAQGIYANGVYTGSGLPNPSNASTPVLAGFSTTAFSVELEFKPDGTPASNQNVIMGGDSYRWLGARYDTDGMMSMIYNNSSSVKGTVSCAPGVWHSLKLAYSGGIATLTVNGTVSATVTVALTYGGDYNFHSSNFSNGSAFKGNWRNLRVYAGTTKIAHYPLCGDARDITGRQTAMTLTNTPFQVPGPGVTLAGTTSSVVTTPMLTGLDMTDFRITAEFSIAAVPAAAMPVITGGTLYRWLGARIQPDGTLALLYNNASVMTTTTVVSTAAKHVVSLRYSAASAVASIYLDGVLAGTQSVPTLTHGNYTNVTTTNNSNATVFKGTLYRIRVDSK